MSKKIKNLQHKEAINRKSLAEDEMAKFGLKLNDDRIIIGFIFEHLAISQKNYLALLNLNNLCKMYAGIDICIFSQHIIPPCIKPSYPVFDIKDLSFWNNQVLVSTNIGTTISALSTNTSLVYHYAFDPEFIDYFDKTFMSRAFCDSRVRVIVRHEDHKKLIEEEFGIDVWGIVPDFDVEKLIKLIVTEKTNG
jgi:hypothetical protein